MKLDNPDADTVVAAAISQVAVQLRKQMMAPHSEYRNEGEAFRAVTESVVDLGRLSRANFGRPSDPLALRDAAVKVSAMAARFLVDLDLTAGDQNA